VRELRLKSVADTLIIVFETKYAGDEYTQTIKTLIIIKRTAVRTLTYGNALVSYETLTRDR
jgi:hypothetical protein